MDIESEESMGDTTECVNHRLIKHGHDERREPIFLVRWYSCGKDEDTRESWSALSGNMVQQYLHRNKVLLRA